MYSRLREERKKRGLSQRRLARILCVDHSSVSHWETNLNQPRPAKADALAGIFGIPADELLSAPANLTKLAGAGASKEDHDA